MGRATHLCSGRSALLLVRWKVAVFVPALLFVTFAGAYTQRWLGNLVLSPIIYLCAGVVWSLEPRSRCWATLAFFRADRPAPPADRRFLPVVVTATPFVAAAFCVLVGFVGWYL